MQNQNNPVQFKFLEILIICKEKISTELMYEKVKKLASQIDVNKQPLTIENFIFLNLNSNYKFYISYAEKNITKRLESVDNYFSSISDKHDIKVCNKEQFYNSLFDSLTASNNLNYKVEKFELAKDFDEACNFNLLSPNQIFNIYNKYQNISIFLYFFRSQFLFIMNVLYCCRVSTVLNKEPVDPSYDISQLLDKNNFILPPIKEEEWDLYQKYQDFLKEDEKYNQTMANLNKIILEHKKIFQ
jgi:hypothetical protein